MIQCLQDLSLSFRENWSNAWGSPHSKSRDGSFPAIPGGKFSGMNKGF